MPVLSNTVLFRNNLVDNYLAHFTPNLTASGFKHAITFIEGMLLGGCGSINAISSVCLEKMDQSSLNRFINNTRWDPRKLNEERLKLLQNNLQTRSVETGFLIIDDTILEKTGKKMEGTSYHYNNSKKKSINGHNLVTSHYRDGKKDYPLHFELYRRKQELEEKGELEKFKTKIDIAIELIDAAIAANIRCKVAVFDSWYFAKQICDHLILHGIDWVSRAKLNRVINLPEGKINLEVWIKNLPDSHFTPCPVPLLLEDEESGEKIEYQYVYETILNLSDLDSVKCIVIKKELDDETGIVLVSSRTDWNAKKIITIYRMRWKIETFYRDSKQNLGLGNYYLRSLSGIKRYWTLIFLSYTFLQYCTSFGILSSSLDDTVSTTGDKIRRFQELYLKSLIDLIISTYESTGDVKAVYQFILRGKYKRIRMCN